MMKRTSCLPSRTFSKRSIVRWWRHQALISDIRLKDTSGVTLFMEAKRLYPKLPVIVITGYPDLVTEDVIKEYGADFFLIKPLDLLKLRHAMRTCL
jgi:two-component system response regulator HydG